MVIYQKNKKGFTLIELLVVIAIIGVLSSIVLSSLGSVRSKARDTKRKSDLKQLANANEIKYSAEGVYAGTAGWLTNPGHGGLDTALTPTYISNIPDDPRNTGGYVYQYWRKDYVGGCLVAISNQQYSFYAKLENPSAQDLTTMNDSFDSCVATTWGLNYKLGN